VQARARFEGEGVPFPHLPVDLEARLRALDDWVLTTRADDERPYGLETFVVEVAQADPGDYALIGHDGHGLASWAMHLYVVTPQLALFLQSAWGGAFVDDSQLDVLRARITMAESIIRASERGVAGGLLDADERLLVVATDFGRSRFRRTRRGVPLVDAPVEADDPLLALTDAYVELTRR
jgi:hypothetical protein